VRRGPNEDSVNWRDTGCEVAPSCLACPLAVCRYDLPGGARAVRNLERDALVRRLHSLGVEPATIAAFVGLSRRHVYTLIGRGVG